MQRIVVFALAIVFGLSGQVWGAETINILHLDPFSGPFKELGDGITWASSSPSMRSTGPGAFFFLAGRSSC